ncbi:AT-hook motif nuclear-localized protein 9-like isoform X1 [Gastrolobium bilobum]|uniref:AT-hook motif nuclear-localized protein 9-like isoform X1 n=1 Tax=Gastrolobium bilobum TaxID=150636 RepID=UPI002AB16FDF|nr:AT-hook motif nuclear-localized protein 9-like isoform X1 [Gastrolobium bilobum]
MEDQNLTLIQSLNSSPITNEEVMHTVSDNNNSNNAVPDAVGLDSASDTVAKSEAVGSGQPVKRGRGRPRKYDGDGKILSLKSEPPAISTYPFGSSVKRSRGRPPGSGKLQILASIGGFVAETAGGSFTPHVLVVDPGDDVVSMILSFFQKGPLAVCILSATGAVSSVSIRQAGVAGGVLSYEGLFEILTLSGSCTYTSGTGGTHLKNGMLSVSLAKPDGRVFGGGIDSSLIAAGPIQLVMATFKQNISKQIKRRCLSGSSTAPNMPGNPDSVRVDLKVPKLIEGERSFPSPTSGLRPTATTNVEPDHVIPATTNELADNVIPPTTNEVPDNVIAATTNEVSDNIIAADNDMHSASVNCGGDMNCQTLKPIKDQRMSEYVDASVPQI